jgi:UDP-glucose 4-epimerase
MRIAVTGANGVNGVWIVRELAELAHEIIAMDLGPAEPGVLPDGVRSVVVDVTDFDGFIEALRAARPDRLVHMAAVMPDVVATDPLRGFTVNVVGSLNALEAGRRLELERVILGSSRTYYGTLAGKYGGPSYVPVPETYVPVNPSPYGSAKVSMEAITDSYRQRFGLTVAAIRFASIYGPGKTARHGKFGLMSLMAESAFRGEPVHVDHGGDQGTDVIYVEDAMHGLVCALLSPTLPHSAYNISSGRLTTLAQYAGAINALVGAELVTVGPGLDYFDVRTNIYGLLDGTRAAEDLGYAPRHDLASGLRRYRDEHARLSPAQT